MNPPERPAALEAAASAFVLEPGTAFLNHGSFGSTPLPVLAEQDRLRRQMEANPVRFLARELSERLREARDACARFLGADPDGLAFLANATTGVNTAVRGLGLRDGDEVVTTDHAYPAILATLERLCARAGATLQITHVPLPLPDDDAIASSVVAACTERTRMVVIDHITSASGCLFPVESIIAGAHARGIPVLVDGAHVPGQLPVDLAALGADFWTGNYHKWCCAPKGSAALWVAEPWRDRIEPTVISHTFLTSLLDRLGYQGTDDPTSYLATPFAIEWLDRVGFDEIRRYGTAFARWARTELATQLHTEIPVRDGATIQMGLVELPSSDGMTLDAALSLNRRIYDEHQVEVPVFTLHGKGFVRVSGHCYTLTDHIERLKLALRAVLA